MVARRRSTRISHTPDLIKPPIYTFQFGPPPLLAGEDGKAYDELLARVSGSVKARDIFEEMWIRDIVDLSWEIMRLKRIATGLLAKNILDEFDDIVEFIELPEPADKLVERWMANDPAAIRRVEKILASIDLTMDGLTARAFVSDIENFERIDRLQTTAEARRNAVLREIDRHRSSLARTLRESIQGVEEAEFQTIESNSSRTAA